MVKKTEEWRPVKGYEGLYEVSNLGQIRNAKTGKLRKATVQKGFCCVILINGTEKKGFRVHRLVAEAFISDSPGAKYVIDHIDGNRQNNRADNLEWITPKECTARAIADGRRKPISDGTKEKISASVRKTWAENENLRKRNSEYSKARWGDAEYKTRTSKAISEGWTRNKKLPKAKPLSHVPDLPGEEWRPVTGFEGCYAVSNLGRVKSLHRDIPHSVHGVWHISEKLLKPNYSGPGDRRYLTVVLFDQEKKMHTLKLHRLVAEAFLEKIPGKDQVNHIDGVKEHNTADNLEWCTPAENSRHAWAHGLCENVGKKNRVAVRNLETDEVFESIKDAAEHAGVSTRAIQFAVSKSGRRAGGFCWERVNV